MSRKKIFKFKPKNLRLIIAGAIIGLLGIVAFLNQLNKPEMPQEKKNEDYLVVNKTDFTPNEKLEEAASGINGIQGIAIFDNSLYISSSADRAIYKVGEQNALEKIAELNFPQTLLFSQDGSITTPVFAENRVVRIRPEGIVTDFITNIANPTSITKTKTYYYATSFADSAVIAVKPDGTDKQVFIKNLDGPISIYYDRPTNSLYIANYNRPSITRQKLSRYDQTRTNTFFASLSHITNAFVNETGEVLASATKNGEGVIVKLNLEKGTETTIINTGLPDPLISYYAGNNVIYLASPSDHKGRIFKIDIADELNLLKSVEQ